MLYGTSHSSSGQFRPSFMLAATTVSHTIIRSHWCRNTVHQSSPGHLPLNTLNLFSLRQNLTDTTCFTTAFYNPNSTEQQYDPFLQFFFSFFSAVGRSALLLTPPILPVYRCNKDAFGSLKCPWEHIIHSQYILHHSFKSSHALFHSFCCSTA